MITRPRVFVETNTIKLSTDSRTVLMPYKKTVRWGDKDVTTTVHEIVEINPNDKILDRHFRAEVDLLSRVADIARSGTIELITTAEVFVELMRITNLGRRKTQLLDAPITQVNAPFEYSRVIAGFTACGPSVQNPAQDAQVAFLKSLSFPRLLQLRKACGADQKDVNGNQLINPRQLIDAFHVWCAEEAGASHFLTCDLKLVRLVRRYKKHPVRMKVVSPSEFLTDLGMTHLASCSKSNWPGERT
jgi:hypothetical protein